VVVASALDVVGSIASEEASDVVSLDVISSLEAGSDVVSSDLLSSLKAGSDESLSYGVLSVPFKMSAV